MLANYFFQDILSKLSNRGFQIFMQNQRLDQVSENFGIMFVL